MKNRLLGLLSFAALLGMGAAIYWLVNLSTPLPAPKTATPVSAPDPAADELSPAEELRALSARFRRVEERVNDGTERLIDDLKRQVDSRLASLTPSDSQAMRAAQRAQEAQERLRTEMTREIDTLRERIGTLTDELEDRAASEHGRYSGYKVNTEADEYAFVSIPALGKAHPVSSSTEGLIDGLTERLGAPSVASLDPDGPHGGRGQFKKAGKARQAKPKAIPMFTLNDGASVFRNPLLSPIIGRVPNTPDSLRDPFRFKLILGPENFAASSLYLPTEVTNTIWQGWAVGVRENSCVRGHVDKVTFIFRDGTISVVGERSAGPQATDKRLGYVADRRNNPCVTGRLIRNTTDYLLDRAGAAGLEAMADAFAQRESSLRRDPLGGYDAVVDGDVARFIAGRTLSGAAGEVADYIRDRARNAFDIVFLPIGHTVTLNLEQNIPIDYDPSGRKLRYAHSLSTVPLEMDRHGRRRFD